MPNTYVMTAGNLKIGSAKIWVDSGGGYSPIGFTLDDIGIKINSSYVRGNIKLAGMILRELEDGVCELDMFAHCDLNGSFPIGPLSVFAVNNTTKQHQRFKDILTKK